MRKLVESTFVTLGGEIGSPHVWGPPYLNDEHATYAKKLLFAADALLLGRVTYEGFSKAYPVMDRAAPGVPVEFIDRMNSIPKYVVSTTLRETTWNAALINGDIAEKIAKLKRQPGRNILKYGTGQLDRTLMEHDLIDEFHFVVCPVALGVGQRLFEHVHAAIHLKLVDATTFGTGVAVLTYTPK